MESIRTIDSITCPMKSRRRPALASSAALARIAYLHGDAVLHDMESMLLVE